MFPPPLAIPPHLSRQRQAALKFLTRYSAPLLCLLFFLAGLFQAGDYGINYDELPQREIAAANLNYILGQTDSFDALLYPHALYGAAFELPLLLAERIMGLEDYRQIHRLRLTLTHLFFILGAFFCYRLAWRLSDSRLIALCALLLYLLHPRLYAHSFFNSKDAPFLALFSITLYLLERAFRRDTLSAFVLLGIAAGLLANLRIMGLLLFPAVIALRGLDLFYAGNWPARRNLLLTAALFAAAAALTWYAATPYAWANPADYLAAVLPLTLNHPVVLPQLFQGQELLSNQLPPHYFPVWFAITTPPLILLLGLIGIAAASAQCLARPAALFRNTRRRFLLLLLACFLLPALAAVLLTPNSYQDWRHLYFLYAPFSLLAALGGGWLLTALYRRRCYWPMGICGLIALALTLVALQMAQIHPWPHLYFNFLVNRSAPEQLRTQYDLDYWQLAMRDGLEYLLELHPQETLTVRVGPRHLAILPPADRQRLLVADGRRRADYALAGRLDPSQPDAAFNSRYDRRLYNNALIALRPLDSSRMTPAAIAAYRDLYRQATAGQPIIQADYAVYRHDRRLTFIKENCRPADRAVRFAVKFFPADPQTPLSPFHKHGSHARFSNYPVRLDDFCLAVIQLPPYAAGDLLVSQYPDGPGYVFPQWDELHSLSQPRLRATLAARRQQSAPPANPNAFALFLEPATAAGSAPRLLYAKANCAPADYETPLFLHIYPANAADLPPQEREQGFAHRDFLLPDHGGRLDGECLAVVPLPDYPITALRTGQLNRWATRRYPAAAQHPADYQSLAGQEPAARAAFNLYWQDNLLIYYRESCAAADTAANFFLHITLQDTADLPRARRYAGFANHDFPFNHWGQRFDGRCLAIVPLPHYPIQTLRTGQQTPGQNPLWSAELTAAP